MMKKFLPPPEATKHTKLWGDVPLWSPGAIDAIEARPEFREALARAGRRKEAARRAVETKLAAMDAWVDGLAIELPDMSEADVLRYAIRHYNDRALERAERRRRWDDWDRFREATEDSDPRFLARIQVNYLRHVETTYEALLDSTVGKVGTERACLRIRARVLDAIGTKFPGLAAECASQKGESS